MTFKKAYDYAMSNSARFRAHDANVKAAIESGKPSACLVFGVEPGETFYYGFDGVDVQKGRHTAKRAKVLTDRDEVLLIL